MIDVYSSVLSAQIYLPTPLRALCLCNRVRVRSAGFGYRKVQAQEPAMRELFIFTEAGQSKGNQLVVCGCLGSDA